jgi:hypothetical protein
MRGSACNALREKTFRSVMWSVINEYQPNLGSVSYKFGRCFRDNCARNPGFIRAMICFSSVVIHTLGKTYLPMKQINGQSALDLRIYYAFNYNAYYIIHTTEGDPTCVTLPQNVQVRYSAHKRSPQD